MSTLDISGTWTGEFIGTDHGSLTLELKTVGGKISGVAHMYEPSLPRRLSYDVVGEMKDGGPLQFTFTRSRGTDSPLGVIHTLCSFEADESLIGLWKAENGQEGTFVAKRLSPFAVSKPPALRSIASRAKPVIPPAPSGKSIKASTPLTLEKATQSTRKAQPVLLLHGPDKVTRQTVSRYLEDIGIAPLVLREATYSGASVPSEPLVDIAERAGFAVVLMTPDDIAHPTSKPAEKKRRPSQNVVFELGYLAATLGRNKILVLTKGELELPAYVLGMSNEPVDLGEGWKLRVARELKSVGFKIDVNGAL
jgi:predicted nucleotide-binding protein